MICPEGDGFIDTPTVGTTSTGLERLGYECCWLDPLLRHSVQDGLDLPGVHHSHVLARVVLVPVLPSVHVRDGRHPGPLRPASAAWLVELVRRHGDLTEDVAVVGVVQGDHVLSSRVLVRQAESKVVGL